MSEQVELMSQRALIAARQLATTGTHTKDIALRGMAESLIAQHDAILAANALDIQAGREKGLSTTLLDRLLLTEQRIQGMAEGLRQIAGLPDPVGQVLEGSRRPNGLDIQRVRVPLGVIGIIYESRPNVTADAAGLCVKSGNAVILRGGSEAIHSNTVIARILAHAGECGGLPQHSIQFIETTDRSAALALMRAEGYIDLLIPRGGEGLKKMVMENATVPVLKALGGNCHTYVDSSADLTMAADIAFNAKVSRPSVCNAMETLLVHQDVAEALLPSLCTRYQEAGVELRGCEATRHLVPFVVLADESDWATEFLAPILAIRVVPSLDFALDHIAKYGTKHSEAIVTKDYDSAQRFVQEVNCACAYVNASTRFTDGFEFGLGAEVGISTQKLHARGPVGIVELTTYKTIVRGNGQIRV